MKVPGGEQPTRLGLGTNRRLAYGGSAGIDLVVVLQAITTSGNRAGHAGKCLIVEAQVGHGPVEVLASKCLTPVLAVVGDPAFSLIVVLGPNYGGLVYE